MGQYHGMYDAAGLVLGLLAGAALILWQRHRLAGRAVAARMRAEQALRETQAHFQELLKGRKGYALFILDANGRVQTWSQEAETLYGYPEAEARGRHVSLFYPPAEATGGAPELHLHNAKANGRIDDGGWRVRRDGRTFRARVVMSARTDAAGRLEGYWCLTEELAGDGRNSGAFTINDALAPLSGAARDPIIALSADGKITFLNRAFQKATGLPRREWLGRPFTTLVHPKDWARVGEMLRRLGEGKSPPAVEVRLLAAPGRNVSVELTATPMGDDGEPQGSLLLARPPAGRWGAAETHHPAEEPAQQSQKLEALGRLAGGIAHDFNNLLTVILGYSDLLCHYGPDAHAREVGGEIQKAGERAAALTRQLLAFSRKQVLQPAVLDLNGLVRNLDSMLRRLIGEDVQLSTALHPEPLRVKADPGQLEQVLTNLVVNVRDAMPKGGRLIISTAEVPSGTFDDSWRADIDGYAMLTVTDGGCGMDEHTLKRLFEPFFTTKEVGKGTGLGLATVYGIVQQSGGRIEVESEPDRGSTFRVYLPLTREAPAAAGPAERPATPRAGGETVLLVEDEEAVRHLASRTLQAQGYNVLEACDGVAALTVCQRHLRGIDIVVTDVVMPQLSGVDLVQRLKAVRPRLKVLYMSGYTDSTVVRHGMAETEANYLQKPFTPDNLTWKVRHLLDQAAARC